MPGRDGESCNIQKMTTAITIQYGNGPAYRVNAMRDANGGAMPGDENDQFQGGVCGNGAMNGFDNLIRIPNRVTGAISWGCVLVQHPCNVALIIPAKPMMAPMACVWMPTRVPLKLLRDYVLEKTRSMHPGMGIGYVLHDHCVCTAPTKVQDPRFLGLRWGHDKSARCGGSSNICVFVNSTPKL